MSATAKERIEARITNMVMRHPFFASCILRLKVLEATWLPTAATDGTHLFYNADFVSGLGDSEISGLLAHEVLHCILLHIWRTRPEWDRELANIAADYEINNYLTAYNEGWCKKNGGEAPFALPKGGLVNDKYDSTWCFEPIYVDLEKQGRGKGTGKGRTPWGEFVNPSGNPDAGDGDGDGDGKGDGKSGGSGKGPVQLTARDWESIAAQAEQAARMMGNLPGEFETLLKKSRRPEIPWTEYMRRYFEAHACDDYDPRIPDRRFSQQDIFLPTLRSEAMGEVVVGIDNSGSIYCDKDLLEKFFSELQDIVTRLKPSKTTVLQCDTRINKVDEYNPGDEIDVQVRGGGGTAFEPFFDWVAEHAVTPKVMVIFTDGQGSYPPAPPGYDVLWVDYGNYPEYPFGDVIRVRHS